MDRKMVTKETSLEEHEANCNASKSNNKDILNSSNSFKNGLNFENKSDKSDERNQIVWQNPPESKSLFRRNGFCMSQADGRRFSLSLTKILSSADKEMTFLGINLIRLSPQDRVKILCKALDSLENNVSPSEKNQKIITKYLRLVKNELFADKDGFGGVNNNNKECNQLTFELLKSGCFSSFIIKLPLMDFEDRKTACLLFCNLLRRQVHLNGAVKYLEQNPDLLMRLLSSYNFQHVALTSGRMLRECLRFESLAKLVIESGGFYKIFEFVQAPTFEVSSDAFLTLEFFLTEHKKISSDFMSKNYEDFFSKYDALLTCDNYVTQISCLRLLSKILLERRFYDIMTKYVTIPANLKRLMILMGGSHRKIQVEAYHVFKIFLANPDPIPSIKSIFIKNKTRLIKLFNDFQTDIYDEQFSDEKGFLIKQLQYLDSVLTTT